MSDVVYGDRRAPGVDEPGKPPLGHRPAHGEAPKVTTPAPVEQVDQQDIFLELMHREDRMLQLLEAIAGDLERPGQRTRVVNLVEQNPQMDLGGERFDLAVQVDNPYAVMVEVHAGGDGAGPILFRVPPGSGVLRNVVARDLSFVAVGAPAGSVHLQVTRFDRPQAPTTYSLTGSYSSALETVVGANPAAGQEISVVVPAGEAWELVSVVAALTTSATAANRRPLLVIEDAAGNIYMRSVMTADQPLSTTFQYFWGAIGTTASQTGVSEMMGQLPTGLVVPAGHRIRTITVGLQVGDDFSAPVLAVKKRRA